MVHVVGGVYLERCLDPDWDEIYGSAGRAAVALSKLSPNVSLHTILDVNNERSFSAIAKANNIQLHAIKGIQSIGFSYIHSLSTPTISPPNLTRQDSFTVEGEKILRFGMMEATSIVKGGKVVYDPQNLTDPEPFSSNGSSATSLAVVVNRTELQKLTKISDITDAARSILSTGAEVVVVKMSSDGCMVLTHAGLEYVPAYLSKSVWGVGSGDIFSAAFTYFWAEQGLAPGLAAEYASKNTAHYCGTKNIGLIEDLGNYHFQPIPRINPSKKVYLAGPFFSLSQRWLIEEAVTHLKAFGLSVFSPYHEIGIGPAEKVAKADIDGLNSCDCLFACLNTIDSGTLFEIGYAVAKGKPVVVFAQSLHEEDLKMIQGMNCFVYSDFVSALYNICWIEC